MSQDCARWRGDLGAYVVDALSGEERTAMRLHLAACPACRAEYEYLLPVRDWLGRTRRHLTACRACRANYQELLHLRVAAGRGRT